MTKDKLASIVFCLAFAVGFGGFGLFAGWVMATTIYDGVRAQDWIQVKADVEGLDRGRYSYRYHVDGREYRSDRLGLVPIEESDTIDDWHGRIRSRLSSAITERVPIMVFVNPDDPSQAIADREIRGRFLIFLIPFAFGFGGVGIWALWLLARVLLTNDTGFLAPLARSSGGLPWLWSFAYFWNVIAFPVGILVFQEIMREQAWAWSWVLLFPLIGVGLLWSAIKDTFAHVRDRVSHLRHVTRN